MLPGRALPFTKYGATIKTFSLLVFGLGETANLLRVSVCDFVAADIGSLAADIDRNGLFPPGLWSKMGAIGLLGRTVANEYGSAEMGYLERVCIAAFANSTKGLRWFGSIGPRCAGLENQRVFKILCQ